MREPSSEIAKLCESWWGKLADSTKGDQHKFAEQLLSLLGWDGATPVSARLSSGHGTPISYMLRGSAQTAIVAHFVMPGALEPPSFLVERGLDFCEATRVLLNESRTLKTTYVFITDLYRSFLYDTRTDELLLYADAPADFRRDFLEVLSRSEVERGALEELRRQPRSYVARQLRQWCRHWAGIIDAESRSEAGLGIAAIDRLIVLRYLFDHDILKRTGWRLRRRFADLVERAFAGETAGCGKALTSLFHDIWFDWKAGIFAPDPALDAALQHDAVVGPLIKEFALLSQAKFSIATILESFNYGDAAEKARVRMVPDVDEDRETYLVKQTLDTIDTVKLEIDIADEGYRAIFHWLQKLVALYDRLETEFERRTEHAVAGRDSMDLFEWSEMDARRPSALADKLHHAVEDGLVLYHSSARQLRTGRLMLYLHLINHYYESKQRFVHFPDMNNVFQERPRVLDVDRKWIFHGQPVEEEAEY